MPAAIDKLGGANAMRTNQAYACFNENVSLTINLFNFVIIGIVHCHILDNPAIYGVGFPSKSVFPALLCLGSDFIQDVVSQSKMDRICSFNFVLLVYKTKLFPYWFVAMLCSQWYCRVFSIAGFTPLWDRQGHFPDSHNERRPTYCGPSMSVFV